jgi:DinB superfamily
MALSTEEKLALINRLAALPRQLETLVKDLTEQELEAHPQGQWTVRQNVHHLADSHGNMWIRLKLALTEDNPTVIPYDQDAWANLFESKHAPLADSLAYLRGLHGRLAVLLESLEDAQWARQYFHPDSGPQTVAQVIGYYAKHGEDHIAQIKEALATIGK